MPKPIKGESKEEFVARFMSSEEAKRDYPDKKQRLAIAYSMWRQHNKKMEINNFTVKAPITKSWEERVDVQKGSKIEKSNQRFFEVTVSGLKEDRDNEMMSQEAVDDMIMQFKSGRIPFFPDHGRDEKTGAPGVYSWKQILGVWVDARQEDDKLLATVRLNKAHQDQDLLWNYIQEGMPFGLSIGGKPVEEPQIMELEQ